MDVTESEWVSKAIDNVDKYLHRGGEYQGDLPQLLGGTDLLNTIGMAMGLPMRDPNSWSECELRLALESRLVYFEGQARKAIDVVAAQIRSCCNGDDKNFVTVLPIELYYNGKLYELPVFRVQRYKDSPKYFVDHIGRHYNSFKDWFDNSKLPPCKMAYPYKLQLMLRPGYDYSRVIVDDTPFARSDHEAVRAIDTVSAIAGIGSGVGLLFVSGGLAAPLVVTGVASAIWGTARSGAQLADKTQHGETVNPFTDSESRMLWLGIAANLVSFGAMGASMRLTSLAMKGQNISNAFRVFVNVANGTNVAVSGLAILDSTIFLCNHHEELSSVDILMHIASVAFWTKGLFTYKTAGTIIRDAQNLAFKHINKELTRDQASMLAELRNEFKNDGMLLREFHRAAEARISINQFSQIILDANAHGRVQFDGAGNLILPGGQKYSFKFLNKLPQNVRQYYFDVITNLSPDQTETFESFRKVVNDDMNLITGLNKVAVHYNINGREATEGIIQFWRRFSQMNLPNGMEVKIFDGKLSLGSAPPIKIQQLPQMKLPMVRFIGEHLSRMDIVTSRQWTSSIPVLMSLQDSGMFTLCPVTKVITSGRAVVSLNNHLQISIYKLHAISADECRNILQSISKLPSILSSASLPAEVMKLCVQKYRLRFQCHRVESLSWIKKAYVEQHDVLRRLVASTLQSHELDRLYTFKSTVDTFKATPYMSEMMNFVAKCSPKSISEMVAYCEFVVKYVETEKLMVEKKLRDGNLSLPKNVKKSEWTRKFSYFLV